jgi:hypothetical protein
MQKREPVRADSPDRIGDWRLAPDRRYAARAVNAAIDREVKDAEVFAGAQHIIDEIPYSLR